MADRTINTATVDGSTTTSVAQNASISVNINVTTDGSGNNKQWKSTSWLIDGISTCENHSNFNSSGTHNLSFDIIAPSSDGTYNLYLVAYKNNSCTRGASSQFVLPNAVTVGATGGPCTTDNVKDSFSSTSYSNNNGSQSWATAWQEIGESDGVSAGQARVNSSNCSAGNCLRIGTPSGFSPQYTDRGASREVDLSGASSATLSFNYFTGYGGGSANVSLEVSNDGGSNWTRLQDYIINSTSFTANPESFDLTPYIAANTQIRLIGSGSSGSRTGMYIDDINIDYKHCPSLTPISAWHMDENNWNGTAGEVLDNSTNNNSGTAVNGATTHSANPAIAGNIGTCGYGYFDGNNDYISASHIYEILKGTSSLTFWMRTTQTGNNTAWRAPGIAGVEQSGGADDIFWGWLDASGHIGISVGNDDSSKSTIPINDGSFHHIVMSRDASSGAYQIYIDGNLNKSGTIASGIIGTSFSSIGRIEDTGGTPTFFDGDLDEVQIFATVLTLSEVQSLMAQTHTCEPGNIIDHFELSYASAALTCLASNVTIKACANSDCSNLVTEDISITLAPSSGWPTNPVTISSGTAELALQHTTAENVVLDIAASSITPTAPLKCYANNILDPTCTINFAEAGFVFDVPTQTACKPSVDVTIAAVKKSNISEQCVGALTGTQSVNFWSTYSNPNTGTKKVAIIGTPLDNSTPGTGINLVFDINGKATFTVQYDDAGQIQLDAEHTTSNGLVLTGNDSFVSKPVMLAAYTTDSSADCVSADASCSKFKKAGELFDLKVNAACWTDDADTDFTDNPLTPNFELAGINTGRSLLAPSGGSTGDLTVSNFNFSSADNGQHTINQAISEVGVFSFSVFPPNYLGEVLSTMSSPPVGRFYPDHFKVTNSNNGAFGDFSCSGFSYSGQNFSYSSNPQLTITAYNAATTPAVTQNYTGDFVKLVANDFSVSSPATDAKQLGADNTNLVRLLWAPAAPSLTDNADGSLSFSFGNDSYTYIHESNSQIDAFNNSVDLTFTAITDDDNVQTQSLPTSLQPSGEPIRFGRLAISNAHGSELVPLVLTVQAEYFNGTNWQTNTADQCTALNLASHFQLNNTGSWVVGTSTMIIEAGSTAASLTNNSPIVNGSAVLTLSAPGEDNQGYVDIRSQLSSSHPWLLGDYDGDGSYDDDPIGRASFGLFKGSDNIIFRRELY
jgi:MSHA biogenesis protein MshQ